MDFDGVIVDTVEAIVSLYNEDYQYYPNFRRICPREINTWWFEECECAKKEEIDNYFNQKRFFSRLKYMPGALKCIKKWIDKGYRIKIVSIGSKPNICGKYFKIEELKGLVRDKQNLIQFIPVDYDICRDKAHIDMSDGIFIDDCHTNLATSNALVKVIFGEPHTWSYNNGLFQRAYDWKAVDKILERHEQDNKKLYPNLYKE